MAKNRRRSFGYIRKLQTGTFQASYLSPSGQRIYASRSFRVRRDAESWLSQRQTEIERGIWIDIRLQNNSPNVDVTIREGFEDWHRSRITRAGKSLAESTIHHYRNLINSTLKDFSEKTFGAISKDEIEHWYLAGVSSGKITTTSKGYKLLKVLFDWAVEKRLVTINPCKIPGAQSAITNLPIDVPSAADVALISESISPFLSLAVKVCAYGGLRYGELAALRREDVVFDNEAGNLQVRINVHGSVTHFGGRAHLSSPKSKTGMRTVQLPQKLAPMLLAHLEAAKLESESILLFPDSATGGYLKHDKFIRHWKKALQKAGLSGRRLTPHGLRHFGATAMATAGATLPDLKLWLGDSSTEAVVRYLHSTDRNRQLANKIEFI